MLVKYIYKPEGVCSREMIFEIEDGIIKDLQVVGGCPGNIIGVSKLIIGKTIDEVIKLLKGIPCGTRGTSCPDQVAIALEKYRKNK